MSPPRRPRRLGPDFRVIVPCMLPPDWCSYCPCHAERVHSTGEPPDRKYWNRGKRRDFRGDAMGWFETAYVIEGRETDDGVAFTISVYGDTGSRRDGGVRIRSLFSWAP